MATGRGWRVKLISRHPIYFWRLSPILLSLTTHQHGHGGPHTMDARMGRKAISERIAQIDMLLEMHTGINTDDGLLALHEMVKERDQLEEILIEHNHHKGRV